jgi:hypothetical protein
MLSSRKRLDLAAAGQHDTLVKAGLAGTNRNRMIITTSHLVHMATEKDSPWEG